MNTRRIARHALFLTLTITFLLPWAQSQQTPPTQPPAQTEDVPVTDGGAGPCSVELTVTGADAKPVFSALVNVHMAYGFAGAHKLDMGVYTNTQGKGKFTGIPEKVRKPPLEFRATKGDMVGVATMNPAAECQAKLEIVLQKSGH